MCENFNDYLTYLRKSDSILSNYDFIDKVFEEGDKRLIHKMKSFLEEKDRINKLAKESETFIFKCFSLSLSFILTSLGIKSKLDSFGFLITIMSIVLLAGFFWLVHFIYKKRELQMNADNLIVNYFMNKYIEL
ncbi:hypothetical protein [Fundicoccus ignavus]|uniref:Uncharacterized protein n=1 Tax=Fundicoccus ignavus TaxID=2664442 RepID=A0A844C909_9LACT|nr:hypothetical protein [Fundicoccus ignavus]MRJ46947.1 hypothetical protein [Fundicoccus ignavus]